MNQPSHNLVGIFVKLFWTMFLSLAPAIFLGLDFGFSVGLGYFVIAGCLLSIHYDAQDIRKAAQQVAINSKQ